MTKQKKRKSLKTLSNIYEEFNSTFILHKIEQEALYFCYEENKDFGHVFSLDEIFTDKFQKALSDFKKFINTP